MSARARALACANSRSHARLCVTLARGGWDAEGGAEAGERSVGGGVQPADRSPAGRLRPTHTHTPRLGTAQSGPCRSAPVTARRRICRTRDEVRPARSFAAITSRRPRWLGRRLGATAGLWGSRRIRWSPERGGGRVKEGKGGVAGGEGARGEDNRRVG